MTSYDVRLNNYGIAENGKVATAELNGRDVVIIDAEYADLALILAAPELLDMLKKIIRAHDDDGAGATMGEAKLCHAYAEMARETIARAEGAE